LKRATGCARTRHSSTRVARYIIPRFYSLMLPPLLPLPLASLVVLLA
jgi:hypothetical protein